MGDEVLLEALQHVKSEVTAEANTPVGDAPAPTPEEPAAPAEPASSEPAPATPPEPAPAAEPAPEEPPAEPEMPKSVSEAWALIEDRMSRVEARERAAKSQEEAIQAEIRRLQEGQVETQKQDFMAELRTNPLQMLANAGVSWHNLASMVLTGQQQVPKAAEETQTASNGLTKEDVAAIVAEALQKNNTERSQADYDRQYQSMIDVALGREEYKFMASLPGAKEMVYNEAVRLSTEQGQVLPPERVISILQERKRAELQQLLNADPVKSALGLEVSPAPQPPESPNGAASQPAGTQQTPEPLGAEAGTTSRPNKMAERKLSDHEILEEALKFVVK